MSEPKSKLIMIKNDANLRKGDVLEVANVLDNVALLQVVHRKKAEIVELPPDTLGVSVSDGVKAKDHMR